MQEYSEIAWHDYKEINRREPCISESIHGGVFMPNDGHVSPVNLLFAFRRGAYQLGAVTFDETTVMDVKPVEDYVEIHTDKGIFQTKQVVIASGVWSGFFFEKLGLSNVMHPVKGECLSVMPKRKLCTNTLFYEDCYIVPKRDGRMIIGASSKAGDWTDGCSTHSVQQLLSKAYNLIPELTSATLINSWYGIRPDTKDHKPIIGKHPDHDHVYFATGHYRNGILLAPMTGRLMKEMIVNKTGEFDQFKKEFSIERFKKEAIT
ncbi:FAD-dependent oxidoreductase [Bacillus carboniphilus]|uniref:FAD-dependent oxidoreductase n=1 Tax=Bacillus carboniphilus TaxID=86663 RepID=UPI0035320939